MNLYLIYNIGLAAIVIPASHWLVTRQNRRADLLLATRIAFIVTLLSFPWDFFAIRLGVWRYPNHPGLTIHGVPLNDLAFIWLCTYLTCSLFLGLDRRQASRKRDSKGENARNQSARHQGKRSARLQPPVL